MSIYNGIYKLIKATRTKEKIPIIIPLDSNALLQDKVSFITGGSGGIGMAIAERLLNCGSRVILGGTNADKLKSCKDKLLQKDETWMVETYVFNNENVKDISEDIKNVANIFGTLDIFINSAGVHTENLDFWNITPEEFDRVMNINIRGPYFSCLEVAKYMRDNRVSGHILVISSSRGSEPAWSPYGISKKCLDAMVQGLAKQFVHYGISISGLAPGPTATTLIGINKGDSIYTDENQLKRLALPDEIATYAVLLISEVGTMATGEVFHISGGRGVFDIR